MGPIAPFLLVLLPALAATALMFAVEIWPWVKAWARTQSFKLLGTACDVEWAKELVMHSAYYGAVIAALLGVKKDGYQTSLVVGFWFLSLMYLSRILNAHLNELEELERRNEHRRTAGMTRSVIRSELAKAMLPAAGCEACKARSNAYTGVSTS
ncbi:MAG: hypothetical protein QE279_03605 [Rhodoferax sp.]|nr:hypothetical protein [Rhodoferax sp.]